MMSFPTLPSRSHTTVFPVLLMRYLSGQIAENTWQRFMSIVDSKVTSQKERIALARFFNELVAEQGPEVSNMPKESEIEDLLENIRA